MNEENQHTIRSIPNSHSQYTRTSTDNWIDAGLILGCACGLLLLIVFLDTLLPFLQWLMSGIWLAVGALWWWHTFRRMAWDLQRSREEQQKDTPATKAKRLLSGIGLLFAGVLVALIFNNLHSWWLPLWSGPLSTVLTASGAVLIVQAIKPQIKREHEKQ